MGKYKAVHLSSVHPPTDTRIFLKECISLSKAGYEVIFIVPDTSKTVREAVKFRSVPSSPTRLGRIFYTSYTVIKAALQEDADIYHLHDPELLIWAHYLKRPNKIVIFDMHENMRGAILNKPWIPSALRKPFSLIFGWIERLLLKDMPVVFAEDSYAKHYPWIKRSVTVLNLPHDRLDIDPTIEKFVRFTVGYMGVIAESRGSILMLDALKILQDQDVQIGLHYVGDSKVAAHWTALQNKIDNEALNGVVLHGRLSQQDGWNIMARCHAGLAVLQAVPNYIESYPTKMFEYMALGLPVIVSDFPLYRNIVEKFNCGICVDPSKSSALADALLYLFQNPDIARAMGRRGREAIQQEMNWTTEANKLIEFYRANLA